MLETHVFCEPCSSRIPLGFCPICPSNTNRKALWEDVVVFTSPNLSHWPFCVYRRRSRSQNTNSNAAEGCRRAVLENPCVFAWFSLLSGGSGKKPKNKTNVRMLLPKAKRKSGSDPWISGKKKENYQSLNYFGVYAYSAINIFMFLYRYIMSGVLKNDFLSGKQPFFAYYLL